MRGRSLRMVAALRTDSRGAAAALDVRKGNGTAMLEELIGTVEDLQRRINQIMVRL
ncbi:MAG: hypothetical protein K6V36_14800 [Anaerolineae bacterium]|nr:hypothetical protein [Anaerolineae bacterium]